MISSSLSNFTLKKQNLKKKCIFVSISLFIEVRDLPLCELPHLKPSSVVEFIPHTLSNDFCFQDFVFVANSFLALKLSLVPSVERGWNVVYWFLLSSS